MSNNLNILIMIAPVVVCMSVLWLVEDCFISCHYHFAWGELIAGVPVLNFKIAALAYTSGKVNIVE